MQLTINFVNYGSIVICHNAYTWQTGYVKEFLGRDASRRSWISSSKLAYLPNLSQFSLWMHCYWGFVESEFQASLVVSGMRVVFLLLRKTMYPATPTIARAPIPPPTM